MWGVYEGTGWDWWMMALVMFVFWGGLSWLIVRTLISRPRPVGGNVGISAKEVAARRFASGEIDEAEYSRITSVLKG